MPRNDWEPDYDPATKIIVVAVCLIAMLMLAKEPWFQEQVERVKMVVRLVVSFVAEFLVENWK